MQAVQIIVLLALVLLLICEEIRFRKFTQRVERTREELQGLAHQMRSPLALLRKYHLFFRSKEFGNVSLSQQEMLSDVEHALESAVVLSDRLLARSQIEASSLSSERPVHVLSAVRAALDAVGPLLEERGHRVVVRGRGSAAVRFDPLLLHGVLDELLINAASYTKPKGTITVSVVPRGKAVSIAVTDTGIGIAPDERSHIFQKFFRGERASKMATGNGLGLAFTKSFVDGARGAIRYASTVNKGTTFTITLPRA